MRTNLKQSRRVNQRAVKLMPSQYSTTTMTEQRIFLRNLLLSLPPGQFETILKNVQDLMLLSNNESLTNEWVTKTRCEYKSKTSACVLDGTSSSTHQVPPILQENMDAYMKDNFSSKGVVSACVVVNGNGANDVVVRSYAERIDKPNYHAGSWTGHWDLQFLNQSEAVLSGQVCIYTHAYEEGRNFHLQVEHEYKPVTLRSSSRTALVSAIVKQIAESDAKSGDQLRDTSQEISDSTLKSLRRVLPVTRTRMDWNVQTHRMVKVLDTNPVQK